MSTAILPPALSYESRLNADPEWALNEGSRHFDERSAVHQSLSKITGKLSELNIPYAVAGGMALFRHGLRRFAEVVDLLVSKDGLRRIHAELEGRGYLPVFSGSKNLRDTETGVRIEFLISGQFPGDGKPKPVAFPEPAGIDFDGVTFLTLPKLVELKLASGMTNPQRLKDLGDVQQLIQLLTLPAGFGTQLHPFVRDKFDELWQATLGQPKRYYRFWPTTGAAGDPGPSEELQAMLNDGVVLDQDRTADSDHICLTTTDPDVARRYDLHEESEFFGLDEKE